MAVLGPAKKVLWPSEKKGGSSLNYNIKYSDADFENDK